MAQDAVLRQLEVIGEAVKQLSAATRERSPGIPWRDIAGMRDVLIHQYFAVDLEQVWEVPRGILAPCVKRLKISSPERNDAKCAELGRQVPDRPSGSSALLG